ncbi:MAG: hypothetical protein U0800_05395 [Isosphaeraceae bacterium]
MYRASRPRPRGIEPIIELFSVSVNELEEGMRADIRQTYSPPATIAVLGILALLVCWPLALVFKRSQGS